MWEADCALMKRRWRVTGSAWKGRRVWGVEMVVNSRGTGASRIDSSLTATAFVVLRRSFLHYNFSRRGTTKTRGQDTEITKLMRLC